MGLLSKLLGKKHEEFIPSCFLNGTLAPLPNVFPDYSEFLICEHFRKERELSARPFTEMTALMCGESYRINEYARVVTPRAIFLCETCRDSSRIPGNRVKYTSLWLIDEHLMTYGEPFRPEWAAPVPVARYPGTVADLGAYK
jgi:hypothetical protein